jgi:hypothetical protein
MLARNTSEWQILFVPVNRNYLFLLFILSSFYTYHVLTNFLSYVMKNDDRLQTAILYDSIPRLLRYAFSICFDFVSCFYR